MIFHATHRKQRPFVAAHDTADRLAQIAAPTLVVSGEYDVIFPPRFGRAVAEAARAWIARAREDRVIAAAAEPTLRLPPVAGAGGRSQHLALLVAQGIRGTRAAFLAEGSDGRDGPTAHAGAAVDGETDDGSLAADLARFDSSAACARRGVALPGRSTGTNLADLHLLVGDGAARRG